MEKSCIDRFGECFLKCKRGNLGCLSFAVGDVSECPSGIQCLLYSEAFVYGSLLTKDDQYSYYVPVSITTLPYFLQQNRLNVNVNGECCDVVTPSTTTLADLTLATLLPVQWAQIVLSVFRDHRHAVMNHVSTITCVVLTRAHVVVHRGIIRITASVHKVGIVIAIDLMHNDVTSRNAPKGSWSLKSSPRKCQETGK